MKIYLAAPYAARDILKEDLVFWRKHDHQVTCGWVKGTRPLGTASYGISEHSTQEEVEAHTQMDFEDIDAADALVLYTAQYLVDRAGLDHNAHNLHSGGRHVETGYALAKDKPVIVVGPLENVFQRGMCMWSDDLEGALKCLDLVDLSRV